MAADVLDEWHPSQPQEHHEACHHPPKSYQAQLGRIRPELLVKIQRHQGRSRVEHRRHATHQGREQRGDHEAHEPRRQQVNDQRGERNVTIDDVPGSIDLEQILIKCESDQAGHDQQEHGKDFQESSEYGPRLGVAFVSSGEHTLHDHLIRTPVPDTEYGRSKKYSRPGKLRIADRPHHMEVAIRHDRSKPGESADAVQADESQRNRSRQQDQCLNDFRVNYGGEPSGDGVDPGRDNQDDGGLHRAPSHHPLQYDGRRPQVHRNLGENIGDDRNAGQVNRALPVESSLQEFRHSKNVRPQVERHEHPTQYEQDQASQPLEIAHRHSRACARTSQADEVLGRNIGDK